MPRPTKEQAQALRDQWLLPLTTYFTKLAGPSHLAFFLCNLLFRCINAANQAGKTTAMMAEVAAKLLRSWEKHQRTEPIIENVYATGGDAAIKGSLLFDVLTALHAQSDRTANLAQAYERIGERLVRATREYIFRVHAMRDADEAERLLAQRRREYQRELTMRRAYE